MALTCSVKALSLGSSGAAGSWGASIPARYRAIRLRAAPSQDAQGEGLGAAGRKADRQRLAARRSREGRFMGMGRFQRSREDKNIIYLFLLLAIIIH
jgi:hypothetical protein